MALEQRYRAAGGVNQPDHLHTVIAIVDDSTDARDRLRNALVQSFRDGDHPHVPQAPNRHLGPDGTPAGPEAMAEMVAESAIIGSVGCVVDELGDFILETGAHRIAVYHEAIGDPARTVESLRCFAEYVIPQLTPDG